MKQEKKSISEQELVSLIQREENILGSQKDFYAKTQNILIETIKTIEVLKEIEKNAESVYFRIGSGVMVEAKITNTKNVKRSFSENGYFEENIKDTKKWLEKRQKNIDVQLKKISEDIQKSEAQLKNLIGIYQKINEEKQKLYSKNISTK